MTFQGTYSFGIADTGHRTGGIGRATMLAKVTVCVEPDATWWLTGTATMVDDAWDFDWKLSRLIGEQVDKVKTGTPDLNGRETRTALGSAVPGKSFLVRMKEPVKVTEKSGAGKVTFSR